MSHTRKGIHLGMYSIKMGEKGAKGQLEKNIHQLYVNVTIYFSSVSIHLKCFFFFFLEEVEFLDCFSSLKPVVFYSATFLSVVS